MNYEELLESRNGAAMAKESMPFGHLYKKMVNGKYENVVDFRNDLKESLLFCDAITADCEHSKKFAHKHQLPFMLNTDSVGIYGVSIGAGNYRTFERLLEDNPAMVIHGDGRDMGLLQEEGIRNTQAFVALTGNAETNILACLSAKKMGVRKTIAMVENLDYVSMAESLDIGTIINKKNIAASHIFQMMLDADVSNMRSLMMVDSDVAEFVAAEGSKVTKRPVKDLGLPFGVTIGGLVRDEKGYLVNGNTQVMPGDSVMVFCHEHNLKKVEKFFNSNTLW